MDTPPYARKSGIECYAINVSVAGFLMIRNAKN